MHLTDGPAWIEHIDTEVFRRLQPFLAEAVAAQNEPHLAEILVSAISSGRLTMRMDERTDNGELLLFVGAIVAGGALVEFLGIDARRVGLHRVGGELIYLAESPAA